MRNPFSRLLPLLLASPALLLAACNDPSAGSASGAPSAVSGVSPATDSRSYSTDVLMFAGDGTWSDEVSSLESIMSSHGATYQEVTSAQLDAMSVDEIAKFGLMIFPGGEGGTEAGGLSAETHARLREAVQSRGVSYLGFCAGAFIAEAPAPSGGGDVSYGLGVVNGPVLDYYHLNSQGVTAAMTLESFADGSTRDLVWYGGPVTPNVSHGVVARYPDGNPAISEMASGAGFVVLSGPHPAAPQATRTAFGLNDSDGLDFDLAWTLVSSALHRNPLAAF